MRTGLVSFIGAGPGAADLLTLRGARRLAEADVVLWASGLVHPDCLREHANPHAEVIECSRLSQDDIVEYYRKAARDRLKVAKLHATDSVLWGAVREHYEACKRIGVEAEIVPGVSGFSAAAAVAGRELADTETAQSIILTRLDSDVAALPDPARIREFAKHGATMAIHAAGARTERLVEELLAGGYSGETSVVVAYKPTWPDELLITTTLGELESTVKQHKLWRNVVFLVGGTAQATSRFRYRKDEQAVVATAKPEPGEVEASPRTPGRSKWSARASRTSRVAARLDGQNTAPESPATSQAAWQAVQGLQDTMRAKSNKIVAVRQVSEPEPEQSQQVKRPSPVAAATITQPKTSATVAEAASTTPKKPTTAARKPSAKKRATGKK